MILQLVEVEGYNHESNLNILKFNVPRKQEIQRWISQTIIPLGINEAAKTSP